METSQALRPGQLVDIGGRRLHAIAEGSGGPIVVFEGGGAGGLAISDLPILRRVARFTRAMLYDRAGLGWSDMGPSRRPPIERASDLHALLAALDAPPPYVLVGSSFGGLGARAFCKLCPDQVAGMVLVDAAEEGQYFATMARMRGFHEQELRDEARRAETGALREDLEARLKSVRAFSEAEKAAMLALFSRPDHHLASLEELVATLDRTPADMQQAGGFGDLGSRPLIVLSHGVAYAGEMSDWEQGFAAAQARLAALSTNGAHIVVSAAGHSIGLERPGLVAAAIAAVVKAVRGAPFNVSEVQRLATGGRA